MYASTRPSAACHRRSLLRALGRAVVGCAAVACLAGAAGVAGEPENDNPTEYEVKAAWIYKFVKYVDWPEERFDGPRAPIVIGVYGKDPFGKALERTFDGKRHDGRAFELVRTKKLSELERCHIVFVPASQKDSPKEIARALRERSVLLIGEEENFAARGGIVNFYLKKKHVRFEINPSAARREALEISSKLLSVARIVEEERK